MYRLYNPKKITWSRNPYNYKQRYVINMPYEGCGPMYRYPHYCPVHLFAATASPVMEETAKPLRLALFQALKLKFDKYEAKLMEMLQENESILSDEDDQQDEQIQNETLIERKTLTSLSATGDSSRSPSDKNHATLTNVKQFFTKKSKAKKLKMQKQVGSEEFVKVPQVRAGL